MRKPVLFLLCLLLISSLASFIPFTLAQEKTYLKVFEAYGTSLKIPTISVSDSVVSYQDTKDFYQFNVTLSKLPASNVFSFPLETIGLEFYYQPPLNEELDPKEYAFLNSTHALNDKGEVVTHRPENVTGSYAVYMTNPKANMTGKLYHIYRPLLIDAKGLRSWANLSVTKTSMTIMCDAKFLAEATYPLVIDPSFGYTTQGASETGIGGSYMLGCKFTLSEDGTVTDMTYFVNHVGLDYIVGIYDDSGGLPNALQVKSSSQTGSSQAWLNFDVADTFLDAGDYWLAVVADGSGWWFFYDSGDSGQTQRKTVASFDLPATFGTPDASHDYVLSIYANYTTGGETEISEYGSGSLTFSVASHLTWVFSREGSSAVTFASGGERKAEFSSESSTALTYVSGHENVYSFLRAASVALAFVVSTFASFGGFLWFYGSAALTFAASNIGDWVFSRFGYAVLAFVANGHGSFTSNHLYFYGSAALSFVANSDVGWFTAALTFYGSAVLSFLIYSGIGGLDLLYRLLGAEDLAYAALAIGVIAFALAASGIGIFMARRRESGES